jgi:hypothetical protein
MKKLVTTIFFSLVFFSFVLAQPEDKEKGNNLKIGIELGGDGFWGSSIGTDRVRKSNDAYLFDLSECGIYFPDQAMDVFYTGVKSEYFFWRNRIGLATGLRFSKYASSLNSDKDYFLWLVRQDQLTTDYVKIHDITQNSFYVGVPLELRFFPNNRELPVQHYFKLGAVFNYRLLTNNDVQFQNPAMNRYAKTVENQIGNPKNFNAYFYPTFGLKIARYPWFNVEISLLGEIFNRKGSTFIRTDGGVGLHFSVQIPLGKTHPMGTE